MMSSDPVMAGHTWSHIIHSSVVRSFTESLLWFMDAAAQTEDCIPSLILFYLFRGRFSCHPGGFGTQCSQGWPWSSDPPVCWDYRCEPQCLASSLLFFKRCIFGSFEWLWMSGFCQLKPLRHSLKNRNPWQNHKGPLRRILLLLTLLVGTLLIFSSIQEVSIECPALNISNGTHALLLLF